MRITKAWKSSLLVAILAMASGSCKNLTVTDPNDASVSALTENPTADLVAAAVQGLIRGSRDNIADQIQFVGVFGRVAFLMSQDGAELVGTVRTPLNGGSFPGTTIWDPPYVNIRNANLVLEAVENVPAFSQQEVEAIRGFVNTVKAYDFMSLIMTRDRFGAPIDVGGDPTAEPAPFVSRDEVRNFIVDLLEEGRASLQNGGGSFPFGLTSGMQSFATPATFVQVNRALRARMAVYMEDFSTALQALNETFLSEGVALDFGAFFNFSTGSGDLTNPLNAPNFIFANTRLRDDAQLRADGTPDLRAQEKLRDRTPFTVSGVTSDVNFTVYDSPTVPVPWVKNEELILLRAQANFGLGNFTAALDDVNFVRVNSGGLEPIAQGSLTPEELFTELLYNKRYSLMLEWGHTWIDLRESGRLLSDLLPVITEFDPLIVDVMPIPESECAPRSSRPEGCGLIPPLNP